MHDLSIIIVNYNARGLLRQCLRSLFTNLQDTRISYTVTVVDNNSTDGSTAMVREQFSTARLIPLESNGGYAKGVNIGVKSLESRYYLILNMDTTIVQSRALERMVIYMDQHADVGLAGPKLINPDGTTQASCCSFPKFLYPIYRRTFIGRLPFAKKAIREYLKLDWNHDETTAVDWVIGTGMIVRHDALQHVGLMDERFFMYYEDVDWCRRFWEHGWKVHYIHDIEIVHYHGRESAKKSGMISLLLSASTRTHVTSWIKYVIKYFGRGHPHGTS